MSSEASPARSEHASALAPGTRLHEFELLRILGIGGFGIVYEAFDHALEREVAIKEYMPASLAGRTETMRVSLRSGSDEESFRLGRESFVKEAKLLARFDHPSLLKVFRYWEDNGTAYMAMPVLRGRTLKQLRVAQQGPVEESWLRGILMPLLGAIETLHRENVYHRDIAPDNIQIEDDGRPVLMDFGAARRVLSDKTQSLTAILKPAYAPIEQYGEAGAVKQGPWTDLYALGATLHYMLLGRPPAPATVRTMDDEEVLLTQEHLPQCSQGFLLAIQWMLRPRPADRPQSVAQLRDVLEARALVPVPDDIGDMRTQRWPRPGAAAPVEPRLDVDVTGLPAHAPTVPAELPLPSVATPATGEVSEHVWIDPARPPAAVPLAADATIRVPPPASATVNPAPVPAAAEPTRRAPLPWILAALVAVGAVAAVFWPRADQAPSAPAPAVATPAAATPSPAAPVVAPAPAAPEPAPSASVPAVPAAASATPESAVSTVLVPPPPVATKPAAAKPAPATEAKPAAAKPVSKPPAPADAAPTSGGPACGARSDGVRYLVCMERECAAPAFARHPACGQFRQ